MSIGLGIFLSTLTLVIAFFILIGVGHAMTRRKKREFQSAINTLTNPVRK